MTNTSLAKDYFRRATIRYKALLTLEKEGGYADAVREAQELVELALKGYLRHLGIEPPRWHDVSPILVEQKEMHSAPVLEALPRICTLSKHLRKERELAFYGEEDYIPSENYSAEEAHKAIADCRWLLDLLAPHIEGAAK